jgi:hypothetical protein
MMIKVTVNIVPSEQFGLNPNLSPEEDRQGILIAVPPSVPEQGVITPASGAIEVVGVDDAPPVSYGVPQLTGGWSC